MQGVTLNMLLFSEKGPILLVTISKDLLSSYNYRLERSSLFRRMILNKWETETSELKVNRNMIIIWCHDLDHAFRHTRCHNTLHTFWESNSCILAIISTTFFCSSRTELYRIFYLKFKKGKCMISKVRDGEESVDLAPKFGINYHFYLSRGGGDSVRKWNHTNSF